MLALMLAAAVLKVGDPAPPLPVYREALRGRALVIEFWATWCAPCVEQIPHWNALVEGFKGRPIQFVAVSYEDEETVKAMLSARPMAGLQALDPDAAAFQAYGVEAVPRTVLVDAKGVIRAITTLQQLTEADIEDLLAGRTVQAAPPPAGAG